MIVNNKVLTDKKEISNTFNDFFVNVGEDLSKKLPNNGDYQQYLNAPINNSMYLENVTKEELAKVISKLLKKKSCGPDSIAIAIIQKCPEIIDPFLHVIQLSFKTGVVPDNMKIAKVIPIHKKNEKYIPGNYRPISLLNSFSKILEKLMSARLRSFLQKYKILYECQFGFREGYSTNLALIDIYERIQDTIDSGNFVMGIYIDLRKAFDTVDHKILLKKMHHYGIRGTVNTWFKSYLENRKQYVSVNGVDSQTKVICTGVPQGSVLGPLLFLLYVNDIAKAVRNTSVKIMLFADDTNVFIQGPNIRMVKKVAEQVMTHLTNWFKNNKLTLNVDKTQFSIFKSGNKNIPADCEMLNFNGNVVRRVEQALYLGAMLDEKLNWKTHVTTLITKLVKYASSFKLISKMIPKKCKRQLYFAYVYSQIQYAIEVYGHTAKQNIKKIQVLQNRILKILYSKDWYTSTDTLHKELDLLKVEDIFKLKVVHFTFQQRKGLLPNIFDSYFSKNENVHDHRTRQSHKLHLPRTQGKIGQKTMKVLGVNLYNGLPENITSSETVKNFRKKTKKFFISKYDN